MVLQNRVTSTKSSRAISHGPNLLHLYQRRAFDEYSDKEREAELTALESQRLQLGVFLQITSNSPPLLQRKHPIPLPLSTPTSLLLGILLGEEGVPLPLKRESQETCNLPSRNIAEKIPPPLEISSQIEIVSTMASSVRQQPPSEQSTQKSSHLLRRRPLVHVTILETEWSIPWLDRNLCDSPLVCTVELPQPPALY